MQPTSIKSVFRFALNPTRFWVLLNKIKKRFVDEKGGLGSKDNAKWINDNCFSLDEFCTKLDSNLWLEAQQYEKALNTHANETLKNIPHNLGGGGIYHLLYFFTRYLNAHVVLETGVAAGYSSHAFLSAMERNGSGELYSSDFPYFRIPEPEKYVGILIDEKLRGRWKLFIDGDEINLHRILNQINGIDIFHYDSDKSYSGRTYAWSLVKEKMNNEAVVLFDDIQDNAHFYDLVKQGNFNTWKIFEFNGKYVGLLTNSLSL